MILAVHKARGYWKSVLHNLRVVPFEAVIAFWCAYSGLTGLLNFGIVNNMFSDTLGTTLVTIFNVIYFISGIGMIAGVGFNRKDIESVGLILVLTSLLVRSVVIGAAMGTSPVVLNLHALNLSLMVACVTRLIFIFKYKINLQILTKNGLESN